MVELITYLYDILLGASAALFLQYLFTLLRQAWPANYASVERPIDNYERKNLGIFALVRLGPVYLAGVLAAGTATALGMNSGLVVVIYVSMHISLTTLRVLWQNYKYGPYPGRYVKVVITTIVGLFVALAAMLAFFTQSFVRPLLPAPSELVVAAWTGFFVAVLNSALQQLTKADRRPATLLQQARDSMGERLWAVCETQAHRFHVEPALVQAVTAAESLQRPPWARRLERVYARTTARRGTYGVAQMGSSTYLSDEASIQMLAEFFASYNVPRDGNGSVSRARLTAKIEKHNANLEFCENVLDFYGILTSSAAQSTSRGADGRPLIIVERSERCGDWWMVRGSSDESIEVLANADEDGCKNSRAEQVTLRAPINGRRAWEITLPLVTTEVRFYPCLAASDSSTTQGDPARVFLE